MAERGTPEFYREEVARTMRLAETMKDAAARLELLDIAAVFQKLADRGAATGAHLTDVSDKKSA